MQPVGMLEPILEHLIQLYIRQYGVFVASLRVVNSEMRRDGVDVKEKRGLVVVAFSNQTKFPNLITDFYAENVRLSVIFLRPQRY